MSGIQEYIDTFDEVRAGYKKLHTMGVGMTKLLCVEGVGKREIITIFGCADLNVFTSKGSVVVTEKHGTYLKVTDQHWVTVNPQGAESIRHDADVLLALLLEQDRVNVLIDPCHEA